MNTPGELAVSIATTLPTRRGFQVFHKNDRNFFLIFVLVCWLGVVMGFAVLATAALALRTNPGTHKRLILLATTVIAGAAYSRWWGDGLTAAFGDGLGGMLVNTYAGADVILAGALSYDLWTRGRLHRVYEVGVPAILLSQIAATLIYHSAAWPPLASLVIGH